MTTHRTERVQKVISGGQVGVDRAGLEFAIRHGIPHGGWCPRGRTALDGMVPRKYELQETEESGYPARTRLNVRNSDATVIFTRLPMGPGTKLTMRLCQELDRPCLVMDTSFSLNKASAAVAHFLVEHKPHTLNVAGSRSQDVGKFAFLALNLAMLDYPEVWRKQSDGYLHSRIPVVYR